MGYTKNLYNSTMAAADPLSSQYPLMGSPHHMLVLVALYLIVCLTGPDLMLGRKPFRLKKTVVVYNFAMSFFNLYICLSYSAGVYRKGYSVTCEHLHTYRGTDDERMFLRVGWFFVLSKFVEFADTILFILCNKTSHVTFLHCYHHSLMAAFTWVGFKFLPGGANSIYLIVNSFVHVVMYIYYGMSAMGPSVKGYLWWKKYLTVLQMSQFVLYLCQGVINAMHGCPIPAIFKHLVYLYTVTILLLFINFYIKAYILNRSNNKHNQIKNAKAE